MLATGEVRSVYEIQVRSDEILRCHLSRTSVLFDFFRLVQFLRFLLTCVVSNCILTIGQSRKFISVETNPAGTPNTAGGMLITSIENRERAKRIDRRCRQNAKKGQFNRAG